MKRSAVSIVAVGLMVFSPLGRGARGGEGNHPIRSFTFEERGPVVANLYRLGMENDPSHIPIFCAALQDESVPVREAAAAQLVFTHDETAIPHLSEALKDSSLLVRRCAVAALERIGSPAAIPALLAFLDRPLPPETVALDVGGNALEAVRQEGFNRVAAALALWRLGSEDGASAVLDVLQNSTDKYVLQMALKAVMLMDLKEAIPDCLRIVDMDPYIGEDSRGMYALRALRIVGDEAHAAAIAAKGLEKYALPGGFVKMECMALMARFGDLSMVPLMQACIETEEDWEQTVRWAVEGIARIRPEGAASYIVNHVIDLDGYHNPNSIARYDFLVFKTAAEALPGLGDPSVIPDLKRILPSYTTPTDWFVCRLYLLWDLACLGDSEGLSGLHEALLDEDAGIRRWSAKFLKRLLDPSSEALLADAVRAEAEPYTFRVLKDALAAYGPLPPDIAALPEPVPAPEVDTYGLPRYMVFSFDDCVTVESMERFADLVEELALEDARWVFTMWLSPHAHHDYFYDSVLVQRCVDRGCEVENHTFHHNPDGQSPWASTDDQIRDEILGCNRWIRNRLMGIDKIYRWKGGGGGFSRPGDPVGGDVGGVAAEEDWAGDVGYNSLGLGQSSIPCLLVDSAAPPFHVSTYTDVCPLPPRNPDGTLPFGPIMGIRWSSDLSYGYDQDPAEEGVEALAASYDFWYFHYPERVLFVNGHDFPASSVPMRMGYQNRWAIQGGFLREVLVNRRARYPYARSMTVLEVSHIKYAGADPDGLLDRTRHLQAADE
ncbi:MAG: HEAT repeat domain-containing protein [Planctomycetota bacterium]